MITHIRKKLASDGQSVITTRETEDNTGKEEYKRIQTYKENEKADESTENVKELALKNYPPNYLLEVWTVNPFGSFWRSILTYYIYILITFSNQLAGLPQGE